MANEVDPFVPEANEVEDTAQEKRIEKAEDEVRKGIEIVKSAFVRVFKEGTPSADDRRIVMENLEIFTRGARTPWHPDERVHCLLTGRHEVFMRIQNYINLPLDILFVEALTPKGK